MLPAWSSALLIAATLAAGGAPPAPPPATSPALAPQLVPSPAEDAAIQAMATHRSWMRRMVAAARAERWPGQGYAAGILTPLASDADPRVRCAAIVGLRRVGAPVPQARLDTEADPRVIRTMLRCGAPLDAERMERGARALMKSNVPSERLLGVEIAAALDSQGRAPKSLVNATRDTFTSIIARLEREDGGALSPRLAILTGAPDVRVHYKWRLWLDRNSMTYKLAGGMVPAAATTDALSKLSGEDFVRFTAALEEAYRKPIDLGVALDCTASMSGEIAQAQGGVEDLMQFVGSASPGMRLAIVGYRDEGDDWKTKWWDFTADRKEAREHLWDLSADGGGDEPELVHEALKVAYGQFAWRQGPSVQRVMVLIGDAPPHPGFEQRCVDMAKKAKELGITTFVLSTRAESKTDEVPKFVDIARAGGGRVIRLGARADLAAELAGLALADTWHDPIVALFDRALFLCR